MEKVELHPSEKGGKSPKKHQDLKGLLPKHRGFYRVPPAAPVGRFELLAFFTLLASFFRPSRSLFPAEAYGAARADELTALEYSNGRLKYVLKSSS